MVDGPGRPILAGVKTVLIASAIGVALLVVDRLMLAAERHGWVYWRRTKPTSGSRSAMAGMFGELNALATPAYRHVIEEQQRKDATPVDSATGDGLPDSRR